MESDRIRAEGGNGASARRSVAGGKHAHHVAEAEPDEHDRDGTEPLRRRWRERLGRWIADPGDCRGSPSHPPPATHEPKRVPGLRIQPAAPEEEDDSPHAGG